MVRLLTVIIAICFFTGPAAGNEYFAVDAGSAGAYGFTYGMPCSNLVDLSESEIFALVHPSHKEEFEGFCIPEDVYNCSDYNGLLYQLGSLERHDGLTCRFISN